MTSVGSTKPLEGVAPKPKPSWMKNNDNSSSPSTTATNEPVPKPKPSWAKSESTSSIVTSPPPSSTSNIPALAKAASSPVMKADTEGSKEAVSPRPSSFALNKAAATAVSNDAKPTPFAKQPPVPPPKATSPPPPVAADRSNLIAPKLPKLPSTLADELVAPIPATKPIVMSKSSEFRSPSNEAVSPMPSAKSLVFSPASSEEPPLMLAKPKFGAEAVSPKPKVIFGASTVDDATSPKPKTPLGITVPADDSLSPKPKASFRPRTFTDIVTKGESSPTSLPSTPTLKESEDSPTKPLGAKAFFASKQEEFSSALSPKPRSALFSEESRAKSQAFLLSETANKNLKATFDKPSSPLPLSKISDESTPESPTTSNSHAAQEPPKPKPRFQMPAKSQEAPASTTVSPVDSAAKRGLRPRSATVSSLQLAVGNAVFAPKPGMPSPKVAAAAASPIVSSSTSSTLSTLISSSEEDNTDSAADASLSPLEPTHSNRLSFGVDNPAPSLDFKRVSGAPGRRLPANRKRHTVAFPEGFVPF